MKRTVCLVMAVLLLAVSLCACGGNKLVGTWVGKMEGVEISMTFDKDGEGKMESMGIISIDFEYEVKNNKLILSLEGEESDPIDFKVSGKTLSLEVDGETMTFTKE